MAVGRYFGLICLSAFSVMPISPRLFALTHGGGLCPVYAVFVDLDLDGSSSMLFVNICFYKYKKHFSLDTNTLPEGHPATDHPVLSKLYSK